MPELKYYLVEETRRVSVAAENEKAAFTLGLETLRSNDTSSYSTGSWGIPITIDVRCKLEL